MTEMKSDCKTQGAKGIPLLDLQQLSKEWWSGHQTVGGSLDYSSIPPSLTDLATLARILQNMFSLMTLLKALEKSNKRIHNKSR